MPLVFNAIIFFILHNERLVLARKEVQYVNIIDLGTVGIGVVRDPVDYNRFDRDMATDTGLDNNDSR